MKEGKKDTLIVTSPAFNEGGNIPSKYTCEGDNINPPLEIAGIPKEAKTLAVTLEDPDAPSGIFDHWIAWNIPPESRLEENRTPGTSGRNSFGGHQYGGPCPPSGSHRYYFRVYALDSSLNLDPGTGRVQLLSAIKDHILASGELMGRYKKAH